MKKIIEYEKDIIFKTKIGEICSISLENEFNVEGNYLKGDFTILGEYKSNELSVNKEPFEYKLPLEYELEKNVDLNTIVYEVENFEYTVKDDALSVYIDLGIRYDEKKIEPIIPEIPEIPEEENIERETEEEPTKEVINNINYQDNYVTYHVHTVKEGETIASIAKDYNVPEDLIKTYNEEEIVPNVRLIIPNSYE